MSNTTDSDISQLQTAAGTAGDHLMAAICAVALGEDTADYPLSGRERDRLAGYTAETARVECARVIAEGQG